MIKYQMHFFHNIIIPYSYQKIFNVENFDSIDLQIKFRQCTGLSLHSQLCDRCMANTQQILSMYLQNKQFILYSAKFWWVKLWRIDHFRVLDRTNVGKFTIANISYLVNLEFGLVKYWQMMFILPNSPKVTVLVTVYVFAMLSLTATPDHIATYT